MSELHIKSKIRKKRYKVKPILNIKVPNVLNRNFVSPKPLEKLCMDVTYIPLKGYKRRFLYLNVVKDLYNNEIIAYNMSKNNDITLIDETINKLHKLAVKPNCILHTDQGFQFTRNEYLSQLKRHNIIPSMSRKGNCWDNSPAEVFFSHLKSETIRLEPTGNFNELREKIDDYIWFYNNERIQIKMGMSPVDYRTHTKKGLSF